MKYFPCLCFTILLFLSCGSSENKLDEQSYTEQKQSLEQKEKKHPLQFLSVQGDDKKNLIGQTVVRGTVYNKATVVSYKSVRVKMLCYKEGKMIEEHEDIVGEIIRPNSEQGFKTKYRLPKGTDSIDLSIMSADVADSE